MSVNYSNYSLLNVFRLTLAFILKNPLSLLEIILCRVAIFLFLYPVVIVIGIIILFAFAIPFGIITASYLKFIPDTKLLTLVFVVPLGMNLAFTPILANGVVEASIYKKYSYPGEKQVSVIFTYIQTLLNAFMSSFTLDYPIAIVLIIFISFLESKLSLILGSIVILYLLFVVLMKIAKAAVFPYAKFLSKVENGKYFSYVQKIPLDIICVMLFYNVVASNILNTLTLFNKTENTYLAVSYLMEGFKLEHLYLILAFCIVTSVTSIVQVVYFDVRDKQNFERSTKLLPSIFYGFIIMAFMIIVGVSLASTLEKNKKYQTDYVRYNTAKTIEMSLEKGEGQYYKIMSKIIKDENKDGKLSIDDLSEENKKIIEEALSIDMSVYEE